MVRVGLTVILRDVHRWSKMPRVGSRPNPSPECQGAEVTLGGAFVPPLGSAELCQSMARGLNGVTTRNIHFYDENFNDDSETVIEDRFL